MLKRNTRALVVAIAMGLAVGTMTAQDLPPAISPATLFGRPAGASSFPAATNVENTSWLVSNTPAGEFAVSASPTEGKSARLEVIRRITLEQVKQQRAVDPAAGPLTRLGQLSVEAAKQHRLGVQADYFPKLSATFANLHYSDFLGQVLSVRRPLLGTQTQFAVPLFSQNQTIAAISFIQPITPLLEVNQAVRIARADERIAMAKAGASVARNRYGIDVEETFFRLLIAQRRLMSAESKLRSTQHSPLYASVSQEVVRASGQELELVAAQKAFMTADSEVRELTGSLNRIMGWPENTALELVPPEPLVENISLEQVADKPAAVAVNPDVFVAEQTVVKARAASVLSKLAYVPTVAAVGGYLFQNAIPLVPSNFGYGGVMVSYNLFDFGKRERAVKEARAQLGMAEAALQLAKLKSAGSVKQSYLELERSRQLSQAAQRMGSSVARLVNVSAIPESLEVKAARGEVEIEMLEADLAHRKAFARLKALMGQEQ